MTYAWVSVSSLIPHPSSAVALATRGCELAEWKAHFALGSLAAACAEAGDFKSAVRWQKKAIELLPADDPMRPKYLDRLAQFEKKQPYREQADD